MNIKNVYILDDRAILYLNGEDTKEFLQNLISNDINKVSETNTCFASLLSPQGKFLYEFIIIKHKSGYLIDCEKSQADELYKQLSIYKLRSKVEILNLSMVETCKKRNAFFSSIGSDCQYSVEHSNKRNVPMILVCIKPSGSRMDRSTCDSAAKFMIALGRYLKSKFFSSAESPISPFKNK